jgi:GntR family transcriptional regulator/MocR family aminotransferase
MVAALEGMGSSLSWRGIARESGWHNGHFIPNRYDHYDAGVKKAPPGILPLIGVDRRSRTPLHRQVYEGYRDAIIERRLRAGERLPSTRALAAELRISRIPVVSAFEQLLAEGYIESHVGSGTFVSAAVQEEPLFQAPVAPRTSPLPGPRRVSRASERLEPQQSFTGERGAFRLSEPALDHFPFQVWSSLVARHSRASSPALLAYGDPMGLGVLREALAEYLRTSRGVRCAPGQIMVVSGSQQALELSSRVLLDPEDPVWVEEPGYSGARNAFGLTGARLIPVPVDDEGLDVSAGIARCPEARAAYVTPSHQYPLGVMMTAHRRLRLLDWARQSGAWIIEDDYDSEYRYEGPPVAALQGLDRDARVIYVGTFSKVLFPALRIGYMVLPEDLVDPFARVRDTLDVFPPTLPQAVLADFVNEGHFGRHLRRMRVLYQERRSALVEAMTEQLGSSVQILGTEAGMHLVAGLPGRISDQEISQRVARQGVWAAPLSTCFLEKPTRQGLVLGYGGTAASQMRAAVARLKRLAGL